ncbi:MAG: tRNA(Ile)(2)-agmatinylcytidine synthase [Desulfurococcaceae archaeon]|uniref:tRNA(Ile2) 2-agmatinylcytidine synthetase TiaS n=1 Tax=Staphylothermus marinus TaxID=2280 RepID=A0A7C4HEK9_STAMA
MILLIINIGFDSIDTPKGGCTTHFVSLLLKEWIKKKNIDLIDYPNLIRLNPAIPWKTRGNGAVALRLKTSDENKAIDYYEDAIVFLDSYLKEYSKNWTEHGDPSISIYIGDPVENKLLKWFSEKSLYDYITIDLVEKILDKINGLTKYFFLKSKRGLIGCLSSIGYRMINTDYTYELIVYRREEYFGTNRRVDVNSILLMDKLFSDNTILNYDYEKNRPLIIPHGPDPVLLGIRGEEPDTLFKALSVLKIEEPLSLIVVFRTNQHTDAHLKKINDLREVYPYRSVRVEATVYSKPIRLIGGHVFFQVSDNYRVVDIMVYEPTGYLRNIVEKLNPGDYVEVMGSVRPPSFKHDMCINLEKIHVIDVKPIIVYENPKCPKCGTRMTSAGRKKGFKCTHCKYRSKEIGKVVKVIERDLKPGWYEPPPRAFKHLMKPLKRFNREKNSFPTVFKPIDFIVIH